jgi:S1-C subfamily serine protease
MRKIIKRAIALVFSVMLMISVAIPAFASNSAIDDARYSVVRVFVPGVSTGTAFIVAQSGTSTVLVTNDHVVSGGGKVFILPNDIAGAWIEAQVTYLQFGLDLAILTTTAGLSGRPVLPLGDIENVRAADTVYAIGFPGTADDIIDTGGWLPSSPDDVTITRGIVSSVRAVYQGTDAIQHDSYISHGNSGGPLLNEDGAVIGVNTWINPEFEASRSINYAIHINYVTDALDEFGIEYTRPAQTTVSVPDDPGNQPDPGEQGNQPGTDDRNGLDFGALLSDYWWVLAIVAGLAIGLYINHRRTVAAKATIQAATSAATAPMQTPMSSPMSAPRPTYPSASSTSTHLICSRGHFAGTTFPINGSLSIGRDPQRCQVVFPSNTQGISSMHCQLRQQGSSIMLMDSGSTYGTFLAGGRKLNANESVTLNPGDSFYLADTKNEFKVL